MTRRAPRQLNLNAFLHDTGHHEASWRHPGSSAERVLDVTYYQDLARRAEAAKLDAVFLADSPALMTETSHRPTGHFEPVTLLTAIAAVTDRIGLVATASTTFNEPYNLARAFGSLDHISGGRAGWNIVTTFNQAAGRNFGLADVPSDHERYARAHEFVDVVSALWDSWEDDALLVHPASGEYLDPEKVHAIDHVGRHLRVRGPLNQPRTPQGRPAYTPPRAPTQGRP